MSTNGKNPLKESGVREIHLVPHSHHDYAWEYPRQWHIWRYIGLFNEVVDWLEENPGTTWFIDNVIHSLRPFIESCPQQAERMKALVKAGRIAVANGGYSLARPSYVGEETFVRNCVEGVRWFREYFGIEGPEFFFNLDTACGQSQIPQLLRLCGHRYYRFQRPEISLDERGVPRQFWWKGLDGSEVLVARGFGGGMLSALYTNEDFDQNWEDVRDAFYREEIQHRRPAGCPVAETELLTYGCDDSRPRLNWYDKPIHLLEFVEEWNRREDIPLLFSTPEAYFHTLEKETLPTVKGPLDIAELSFNLPVKGNHSMWRHRFNLERLLTQTETLCVLAASRGMLYPGEDIRALWLELFEITGHAIEWVDKDSDHELTLLARHAETSAELLMKRAVQYLADTACYGEGLLYVVVNSTAFERKECVEVVLADPLRGLRNFYLTDETGTRLEYQIIDTLTHGEVPSELRRYDCTAVRVAVRVKVPALGCTGIYMVYEGEERLGLSTAAPVPEQKDTDCFETDGLSVCFERGVLKSVSTVDGKIYQGGNNGLVSPKFYHTASSTGWMLKNQPRHIDSFQAESWGLKENGPVRWIYEAQGRLGEHRARLTYIFTKGRFGADCRLVIDSRPADGMFVAAVPCDGCCVPEGDVYFGVEQRDVRSASFNQAEVDLEGQCFAKSFMRFYCSGSPIALVSSDCSMYYRHDTSANTLSVILTRTTRMQDKTENWFTHCPDSFEVVGEHSYSFSLYFGEGNAAVTRFRQTLAYPLKVAAKNGREGTAAWGTSLFAWDADHAVMTALYRENDRTVLRFYETEGKSGEISLKTAIPFRRAYCADLLLEPLPDMDCTADAEKGSIRLTLAPWKIVTMVLEDGRESQWR